MSGAEAVRILFSGAAMDTQTVNCYDGARRDFPCVWSRGSPHTLFRRRKGHPDPRTVMCLEQRPSACSFQAPQWTPRPERRDTAMTSNHTFAIISVAESVRSLSKKKWKGVTAGHESIGPN